MDSYTEVGKIYVLDKNENLIAVFDKEDENPIINPQIQETQNAEAVFSFSISPNNPKWLQIKNPENLYVVDGKAYSTNFEGCFTEIISENNEDLIEVKAYERQKLLSRKFVRAWNSETGFESIDTFMVVILSNGNLPLKNNGTEVPTTRPKGTSGYVLDGLLYGTGWTTGTCNVTDTFDFETDQVDIYENILKVQEIFGGILVFDSVNKIVHHMSETAWLPYNGYEVKYQKNMQSLEKLYNNKIITKLCPLGEGGLNIKSVNNGSEWLTNYTYTTSILEGIENNPDIYDAEQLKRWGERKLKDLCKPRKELTVNAVLLYQVEGYELERVALNDIVDVINYANIDNDIEQLRVVGFTYKVWDFSDATIELSNITLDSTDIFKKNVQATNSINAGTLNAKKVVMENKNGQSVNTTIQELEATSMATVAVLYALGDDTEHAPETGWSTVAPQWEQGKYMWQRTDVTYASGTTITGTPTCIAGAKGDPGSGGVGISFITEYYAINNDNTTAPADSSFVTSPIPTMTSSNRYLWNYELITYTDNSTEKTGKRVIGTYGDKGDTGDTGPTGPAGNGINSTTITYGVSSSPSTMPSNWQPSVPTTISDGDYLWTRTIIDYTDTSMQDTVTYTYARQGEKGDTGSAGTSVTVSSIEYQAGTSPTQEPLGTWSPTPVSVPEGQYLWTKTTFSDGNIAYGVAKQGESGDDGKGISSILNYYQVSTDNTTEPSTWVPQTDPLPIMTSTNKYLWNYEYITYTDNTHYSSTPAVIGTYGDTGVGISTIKPQYYLSTSNEQPEGGEWQDEQVDWEEGKYIWTRSEITWNDSTVTTTTPILANALNSANEMANSALTEISLMGATNVEGQEITVDASNNLARLKIYGNTKQNQYQGYNLFDYYNYPVNETKNGVTITNLGNGVFKLNGTCSTDNTSFYLGLNSNIQAYSAEGKVTHKAYYISGTCTKVSASNARTAIRLNYNQSNYFIRFSELDANNPTQTKTSVQSTTTTGWAWQVILGEGDIFDNYTIKYQLEKGDTAHDWEPYTGGKPSPSPDFPQKIINIGSNINLFDEELEQGSINGETGANASSSSIIRSKNYIEIPDGINTLRFIREKVGTSAYAIGLRFYNSSKTYLEAATYNVNSKIINVNIIANAKYLRFVDLSNDLSNKYKVTTDLGSIGYTPYNIGSIDYKIENKNLAGGYDYTATSAGVTYTTYKNGTIRAVGTANGTSLSISSATIKANNWQRLLKAGSYTLSGGNSNIAVQVININGVSIATTGTSNIPKTFTINEDTEAFVRIQTKNGSTVNEIVNVMLEKDNIATTYEEHKEELITIPLPQGMELCKLNDYSDYLYEDNGKWYKHKAIDKIVLDGTESWNIYGTGTSNWFYHTTISNMTIIQESAYYYSKCSHYKLASVGSTNTNQGYYIVKNSHQLRIRYGTEDTTTNFKTWLAQQYTNGNPVTVYYVLETQIEEEITDEETLDILNNIYTYKGINYIYCTDEMIPSNTELRYYPNTAFNENVIKEFNSDIIKNKDSILLYVQENYIDANNNDYVKQNTFEETIDGLRNTLLEKGGNNEFYYAKEFWTDAGSGVAKLTELRDEDIIANSVSGFGYYIDNGVAQQIQSVRNGIHTISFKYRKTVTNAVCSVSVNDGTAISLTSTTWEEKVIPITVTTNLIKIKFQSDSNSGFKVTDLMVAYGSDIQIWTQNPNETRTDTVTIGKGILVESSEIKTVTKIDADGTRIYNKNDMTTPSTIFTDEGTVTNQIEAEKGKISGISMKIVDNQTWLSSIL